MSTIGEDERGLLALRESYADELGRETGEHDPLLMALNDAFNLGHRAALAARSEPPRVLTQVQAAILTDAMRYPDNEANHCRWCNAGASGPHWENCYFKRECERVDEARALVDVLRNRSALPSPPVAPELGKVER